MHDDFGFEIPDVEFLEDEGSIGRSSCLRIGTHIVIEKLIAESGLDKVIKGIYNDDDRGVGLFFDLASCFIVTESNDGQVFPDYAYNHPLFTPDSKIYSETIVSDFVHQMTMDDAVDFQDQWNAKKDHAEKIYISFDSRVANTQTGDIELAEDGYAIAYDSHNRNPLFYETYPGGIVDMLQLQGMLNKAKGYGYSHAGFILDRGYFSRENISFMDQGGYDFVIMVKGREKLVRESVLELKDSFESSRSHRIKEHGVNGTTKKMKIFASDEKDRYLHIYFSPTESALERAQLEMTLDQMGDFLEKMKGRQVTIDQSYERFIRGIEKGDVIRRDLKLCGYFCILTSEAMTAEEAINLYKGRETSELLFGADKTFLENESAGFYSIDSLDGKMLLSFAALIIRNRFYTKIQDAVFHMNAVPKFMNVSAAIKELEKIEMLRQADGIYRLDRALTASQKVVLKAFGMDDRYVKKKAKEISERLWIV